MPTTQDARRTAVAVGVLVVGVVVCAAVAGPWHASLRPFDTPRLPTSRPTRTLDGAGGAQLPERAGHLEVPDWLPFILAIAILAVLARLLVPLVRRLLAARRSDPDAAAPSLGASEVTEAGLPATPALEDGVAAAMRLLDDERLPPGDAVIAAWVALEDAAARSGVTRTSAQTASEFTVQVLDATQADPAATRSLLDLYLAARFSEHVLTVQDVRGAREALVVLADGVSHLRSRAVQA